jgi:hypothetical protein
VRRERACVAVVVLLCGRVQRACVLVRSSAQGCPCVAVVCCVAHVAWCREQLHGERVCGASACACGMVPRPCVNTNTHIYIGASLRSHDAQRVCCCGRLSKEQAQHHLPRNRH